ncbi:MAG: hypothetical protein FWE24_09100 [Defluviitaleaceae bacterium]|nr:hypothetical protein [Defluviitaleaceae bacterium]
MRCKFIDNRRKVKGKFEAGIGEILHEIGKAGITSILDMIDNGYDEPILDTGALKAEQSYHIDEGNMKVAFGVPVGAKSAVYARFVHEGTIKMEARPFIRDALLGVGAAPARMRG